jgi:hypothetical protein
MFLRRDSCVAAHPFKTFFCLVSWEFKLTLCSTKMKPEA